MAERYKGRLIEDGPGGHRPCWVYRIKAPGFPNLYFGTSSRPDRRFEQHKKRFWFAPQPLSIDILRGPISRFEARKIEIDLHIRFPHAADWHTVKAHVDGQKIEERKRIASPRKHLRVRPPATERGRFCPNLMSDDTANANVQTQQGRTSYRRNRIRRSALVTICALGLYLIGLAIFALGISGVFDPITLIP